jgi:hypothetical protein
MKKGDCVLLEIELKAPRRKGLSGKALCCGNMENLQRSIYINYTNFFHILSLKVCGTRE